MGKKEEKEKVKHCFSKPHNILSYAVSISLLANQCVGLHSNLLEYINDSHVTVLNSVRQSEHQYRNVQEFLVKILPTKTMRTSLPTLFSDYTGSDA